MKNKVGRPPKDKIHRAFKIPPEVDQALGYVAIELGKDKSELVEEALRLHLPTLSNLAPVQAIGVAA